ncbi:MAG: DUF885 domain-containing protein [Chitinophagales bacterium]|nr:DUF885 domain-containing protein [Chitinophagales bacterium]
MRYPLWLLLVLALGNGLMSACQSNGNNHNPNNKANQDAKFEAFKARFIDALWAENPEWAAGVGYYRYADRVSLPDEATRQRGLVFAQQYLDSLAAFDGTLSVPNQTDRLMMRNQLEANIWYTNEFRSYEWDPSNYNVANTLNTLLEADYAPLPERLAHINQRLTQTTAYYAAAKANLRQPTQEHTELGILQNEGALSVFDMLTDSIKKAPLAADLRQGYMSRVDSSRAAVKNYIAHLQKILADGKKQGADKAFRSFRIGKDLFSRKFAYDIVSDYSAEQMFNKALEHKRDLHEKMKKISHEIWAKHMGKMPKPDDDLEMIKLLIDKISEKHVQPNNFVAAIRQQIPELSRFITEHQLIYIDPTKPLEVRETPLFMRGVAGASISSPGPYDKNAPTFYNVTPLDGYTPQKAESYLREYNHYILQILNIHEAIPGHYTQLVYSNNSPSLIKAILGNGAMIEGWAVYGERMMLEQGYGNNEPEMWLMYYKWNLRSTCNTILDYGIHVLNYSEKQVNDLLVREAFQQSAEAGEKWRRATLSQVQLCSYFSGFREIYDLRESLRQQQGEAFNLKAFHEQFLSYGSAPVKYIKQLMKETP